MEMSIRFPNLKLEFGYVGRAFSIFGFEITIYGLLIAAGMLLGIFCMIREARRSDQDQNRYLEAALVSLTAAVVGARLFYVICSQGLYKGNPMEIFNLRSGGYAFYGGLLGGVLAADAFCRIFRLSFGKMADTAAPGILIGQAVGRWGDFFNRESFGDYTGSLFAMELPLASVRPSEVTACMRENLIVRNGASFISVHPVFLYESIWCILLFVFLLLARRKKRFQGEVFMLYLAGYGLGRFYFEYLRTDSLLIPGTKLPVCMIISAALVLIFCPMVCVRRIMVEKRAAVRRKSRERKMRDMFRHRQEPGADLGSHREQLPETENHGEKAPGASMREAKDGEESSDPVLFRDSVFEEEWEKSEQAHIGRIHK